MSTTLNQLDTLLAEVQRMRDEHVRLQEENERLKQQVAPVPVSYPVGTKYVWSDRVEQDDMLCRHVTAIQLKKGVLQVKDRTSGKAANGLYYADGTKYDASKKFYESLDAWKASLPEGFTRVESSDGLSPLERRLRMPFPTHATGDSDALRIFCSRWKVYARAVEGSSPAEELESSKKTFRDLQHRPAYIPTGDNYDPVAASETINNLKILRNCYAKIRYLEEHTKNLTNYELYKKPIHLKYCYYRAKLYALVQGQPRLIVPIYKETNKSDFMFCNGRKGMTFAELGIDLKPDGTPYLELSYRTKYYKL